MPSDLRPRHERSLGGTRLRHWAFSSQGPALSISKPLPLPGLLGVALL